jgi:uncharacterized RDD family membrane protein YckC
MPQPPRQLDSRIEIVTPENIAFHYVVAGPFRRLPAYLIDGLIITTGLVGALIGISIAFSVAGFSAIGIGVWLLIAFATSWFYFGLFETFWNGQTPGKRMMGLRVLSVTGQPINAMQAILRNILRAVDGMPVLGSMAISIPMYMVGILAAASNSRYQRLGDLAAGTMVAVESRSKLRGLSQLNHPDVVRLALDLPRSLAVNRGMAQALSLYVARRDRIAPARRFEIARTLSESLAERFGLPRDINPDLMLCALYYRTFIADTAGGAALSPETEAAEMAAAEVAVR